MNDPIPTSCHADLARKNKMQRPKSGVAPELEPIVRNEDNRFCVDCGAKGPRWASVNLGYEESLLSSDLYI